MPRRLAEQSKQYRQWAEQLRSEAASHPDNAARASLAAMADEWDRLAAAADRDFQVMDKWNTNDRRRD
jgi:hypothetical protein